MLSIKPTKDSTYTIEWLPTTDTLFLNGRKYTSSSTKPWKALILYTDLSSVKLLEYADFDITVDNIITLNDFILSNNIKDNVCILYGGWPTAADTPVQNLGQFFNDENLIIDASTTLIAFSGGRILVASESTQLWLNLPVSDLLPWPDSVFSLVSSSTTQWRYNETNINPTSKDPVSYFLGPVPVRLDKSGYIRTSDGAAYLTKYLTLGPVSSAAKYTLYETGAPLYEKVVVRRAGKYLAAITGASRPSWRAKPFVWVIADGYVFAAPNQGVASAFIVGFPGINTDATLTVTSKPTKSLDAMAYILGMPGVTRLVHLPTSINAAMVSLEVYINGMPRRIDGSYLLTQDNKLIDNTRTYSSTPVEKYVLTPKPSLKLYTPSVTTKLNDCLIVSGVLTVGKSTQLNIDSYSISFTSSGVLTVEGATPTVVDPSPALTPGDYNFTIVVNKYGIRYMINDTLVGESLAD